MAKLCLGTVQFGMKYGVNNQIGRQPTWQESFEMIDYALENGIDTIDTARAYGEAELVLGEYFVNHPEKRSKVKVISKLRPNVLEENSDVQSIVEEECKASLKRMHLEQLNGYLLHTPEYIYNQEVLEALCVLKKQGLVENIGVSIYDLKEGLAAVNTGIVDYIQLPYSVLDQRGSKESFFRQAKEAGITIFTRSAFLQGLFMMQYNEIPSHLEESIPYIQIFEEVREKHQLSKVEALLQFVRQESQIDYVVFGVETKRQLEENIRVFNNGMENEKFVQEIKERIGVVDKNIIFPSLWSNGKKAE